MSLVARPDHTHLNGGFKLNLFAAILMRVDHLFQPSGVLAIYLLRLAPGAGALVSGVVVCLGVGDQQNENRVKVTASGTG